MTSTIYLAARFTRAPEMQGVRDVLHPLGYRVTSRWIDLHPDIVGGPQQSSSATAEALNDDPGSLAQFGQADVADVLAADTLISFSSGDGANGKGGRHVEFGMALALGKRLILVGPRENIFHALPEVEQFPDWPRLVMALSREAPRPPYADATR